MSGLSEIYLYNLSGIKASLKKGGKKVTEIISLKKA